jgi:hypothetical protein
LSLGILSATAGETYFSTSAGVEARLDNIRQAPQLEPDDEEFSPGTRITKTFALPFDTASVQVNALQWNVFDRSGQFLRVEQNRSLEPISVANSFTFREMRGHTVMIETQYEIGDIIYTLSQADFYLVGNGPVQLPASVSPAFKDAYGELADNYETSYLRTLPVARPKMLIISHSQLANYQTEYIKWKRSLGFDVYVVNKSEIGTSLNEFKAFIASHYQQYHCDYLMLWGDVNGTYSIPTAFYPSPEYAENDADDHQYTLIEGDDYFPEMLVGRFSFNDIAEFMTMANKTILYEKQPFMTDTTWMRKGLVVAGNYAEGGLRPTTPIHMSRWLRDKMLDYGYTQVDSVFYPPTFPGTSSIVTAINQGLQIISYRGWGDANGWHYPYFHLSDLNSTVNGPRMPIVFSIVCNTGDFANSVNPSFGEKWMRMGSVAQPNGCVAFVGPSDLHTKTRLNNSISSGAFRSILDYGVRGFGSSVLMGKMELYRNFPNDIGQNQYVPFYFHVYNLLSDPSLNMWILVPDTIPESVIEGGLSFSQSDSHIRIAAPNLEGAMVSGTKNGTTYSYATVSGGVAVLSIDPEETGDLTVTVSKPNFVPLVRTLTPSGTAGIGIVGNTLAGSTLNPNQTVTGQITLKNYGTTAQTVSQLSFDGTDQAGVEYTHSSFNLAAGASHTISFQLHGSADISPRQALDFTLSIPDPATSHIFRLFGGGAEFSVLSAAGTFPVGQQSAVSFEILNTGSALTNASVQVVSLTEAASYPSAPIALGAVGSGETKTFNTTVTVGANAWNGRNLPLKLIVTDNGYSTLSFYNLTAGTAGNTSPTGPDAYGYYAYESFDAGFGQTPIYQWVEIDPLLGGQAELFPVMDDGSRTVNLPFSFRFYGQEYDQITLCSNGWLSFGATGMFDFYNQYIPAALGPDAMVAGYWDDLKGMKTGVDNEGNGIFNDMRVLYWHDAANNRYIVQWNDAYNQYNIDLMQNASLEKFQIILYPQAGRDGDIVVQYHTVDNPGTTTNYCTVGIENHTQTIGLEYTHGNMYPVTATTLQSGLAIKFTTIAPDTYVSNDDQVNTAPFALDQNYPNPFNPTTTISFSSLEAGKARLTIHNLKGQVVRTLMDGEVPAGKQSFVWNGTDDQGRTVGSGVYLYNLQLNGKTQQRKMLLMK